MRADWEAVRRQRSGGAVLQRAVDPIPASPARQRQQQERLLRGEHFGWRRCLPGLSLSFLPGALRPDPTVADPVIDGSSAEGEFAHLSTRGSARSCGASPPSARHTETRWVDAGDANKRGEDGRSAAGAPTRMCVCVRARPSKRAHVHPKRAPGEERGANLSWWREAQMEKSHFFYNKEQKKKTQEKTRVKE